MGKYFFLVKATFLMMLFSVYAAAQPLSEQLSSVICDGTPQNIAITANQTIEPHTIAAGCNIELSSGNGNPYTITFTSSAPAGALFTINENALLTLNENIILKGRNAAGYPVVMVNAGTFEMKGGEITENVVSGGSSDGRTRRAGGVAVNNGGTFNMYGGKIYNNTYSYSGIMGGAGGVLVYSEPGSSNVSSFNIYGGIITENTYTATNAAGNGAGGVYVSDAILNMAGGTISSNEQAGQVARGGGGVYLANTSTFNMSGGTIENNTAAASPNGAGSGVFVISTSTIHFSGKPIISDGIYAAGNLQDRLKIDGNFEEDALVTIENCGSQPCFGIGNNVTGSFPGLTLSTAQAFTNKEGTLFGAINNAGNRVIWGEYSIALSTISPFTAIYNYASISSQTVTVTNGESSHPTGNLTVALSGEHASSFEISDNNVAVGIATAGGSATFKITPKMGLAVGTYTAKLTVSGHSGISESLDISFEVSKAPLTLRALDATIYINEPEPLYDYTPKEVADLDVSGLTFTLDRTFNSSVPGEFTITPSGASSDNYEIWYATGTLTVSDKLPVVITIDSPDVIYGDNYNDPAVTINGEAVNPDNVIYKYEGTTFEGKMADGSHYGPTDKKPTNPGEYTVTVVYEDETHYGSKTESFIIHKKDLQWTVASVGIKPYDGTTAAYIFTQPELIGIVGTDAVNIVYGTAAFSDANAAPSIPIIALDYNITGDSLWKYNAPSTQPIFGNGQITKAPAPNNVAVPALIFFHNVTEGQVINLANLLPDIIGSYGTIAYTANISGDNILSTPTNGELENLMTVNVENTFNSGDATITVTVVSTNYADFAIIVPVRIVDKTDISNSIVFGDGSAVYNGHEQTHETATISGASGGTWQYTYLTVTGTLQNEKPFSAGTYVVIAVYEDATNIGIKTATFIINPAEQNIVFVANPVNKTYGDEPFTNPVINLPIDGGAVTYSSDNTKVATVNPNTGEVTIYGAGEAIITATAAAVAGKYKESHTEYTLTVEKGVQTPPELQNAVEISAGENLALFGVTDIAKYQNNAWEYSIDFGATWKDELASFDLSEPNWEYTIWIRKKETDNYFASEHIEVKFRTIREPIFIAAESGGYTISFDAATGIREFSVAIYDAKGNIVFKKTNAINGEKITLNTSNGMYFAIATAKDASGKMHRYSSKIGVRK